MRWTSPDDDRTWCGCSSLNGHRCTKRPAPGLIHHSDSRVLNIVRRTIKAQLSAVGPDSVYESEGQLLWTMRRWRVSGGRFKNELVHHRRYATVSLARRVYISEYKVLSSSTTAYGVSDSSVPGWEIARPVRVCPAVGPSTATA